MLLQISFCILSFQMKFLILYHLHITIWYPELIVGNPGAIHIGLNGLGPFNWLGKKYVLQHVRWEATGNLQCNNNVLCRQGQREGGGGGQGQGDDQNSTQSFLNNWPNFCYFVKLLVHIISMVQDIFWDFPANL